MAEIVVLVTTSSEEEAARICRALVEEGLAACGNIIPGIQSIFRWEGTVCQEPESLLVVKTHSSRFEEITNKIKSVHSYSVPEIIALPIVHGSTDYLAWIKEMTQRV